MEVCPVKEVRPPKYPRISEVSPESIKEAVPRRWSANDAATAALVELTVPALIVCMPGQITEFPEGFVTDGVPMPPPVWPFFVAAGFIVGLALYFNLRVLRKRKKSIKEDSKENTETETESEEYDEGEY